MCPWLSSCAGCQAESLTGDADKTSKQKMTSEVNMDMPCALILRAFGIRFEHRRCGLKIGNSQSCGGGGVTGTPWAARESLPSH